MKTLEDPRDLIRKKLEFHLIGPADGIFDRPSTVEIIIGKPLHKYYSAILFPGLDVEDTEIDGITDDDDDNWIEYDEEPDDDTEADDATDVIEREEVKDQDPATSELYPRSMGLTFCLPRSTKSFTCVSEFGTYQEISPSDKKTYDHYAMKMPLDDFQKIKNMGDQVGENIVRISDLFNYDADHSRLTLKRALKGTMSGTRTGDFELLDSIRKKLLEKLQKSEAKSKTQFSDHYTIFNKLMDMTKPAWVRADHTQENIIQVSELLENEEIRLDLLNSKIAKNTNLLASLYIKLVKVEAKHILVRAILVNSSTVKLPMYIPNNEVLNGMAMFQCGIKVICSQLMPLPTTGIRTNPTKEDSILDCQYRNCLSYGQAHNCSIEWKDDGGTIVLSSTFLPSVRPQIMVSNTDNDKVNAALSIHRNSSFSKLGDDKILSGLDTICIAYKQWIEGQEEKRDGIGSDFLMIAGELIEDQKKAFARMSKGVELLRKNKDMLECYKLANASMLVNMLVYSVEHLKRQDPSYYLASEFEEYRYYLFQLAFLLLNIESMVDPGSSDRKDGVDILWFPTGGGKTEAYLLLAAFTLIWRRKKHGSEGCGTAIIMRYTLRLLTSQQFERACKIILAMNYVCKSLDPDILSEGPFSIGLWIGGQSSPNSLKGDRSADECVTDMLNQKDVEQAKAKNRFPLDTCPWCGDSLVKKGDKARITTGYRIFKNRFKIFCLNPSCMFNESLPIDCVDESLYAFPPSLLFATIDKFAQLAWKSETEAFFGMRGGNNPPELIIQDELHLIAGPLGTISGLFENIVELLCSRDEFLPKIIASTATIKNASAQVGNLYGNRKAFSFPPPGLDYNDNFFAVADKREPTREYVGVYPTGKTFITTQVKLLSLLLYSRWELLEHGLKDIDNYWSLVSYHNSLRELGRIVNKAGDEIAHSYKALVYNDYPSKPWRAKFNYPKELTSRITGYSVKKVLASVSMKNVDLNDFDESIRHSIDLVFATNMISVGLDIDRFNLMLVNGQPRSISEYVQVTSRIARKYPGIIISAFNPVRVRDRSHFESFTQFHGSYYKFIEPISITPFTKAAIDRMSATILAAFLRIKMGVEHVKDIDDKTIKALYEYFDNRIKDPEMAQYMREAIQGHLDYAKKKQEWVPTATIGKDLLVKQSQIDADNFTKGIWLAMDSMRDVGSNAVLKIQKQ